MSFDVVWKVNEFKFTFNEKICVGFHVAIVNIESEEVTVAVFCAAADECGLRQEVALVEINSCHR